MGTVRSAPEAAALAGRRERPCRILRIAGPLVEMEYADGTAMYDLVSLGDAGLPGEVVAIKGGVVTVQAYEYTGGLAPGHGARPLGIPLSARLGPGLLGGIFDGLLRPLSDSGDWLLPGASTTGDGNRAWRFTPGVTAGERVSEGQTLGEVREPDRCPCGSSYRPAPQGPWSGSPPRRSTPRTRCWPSSAAPRSG